MSRVLLAFCLVNLLAASATLAQEEKKASADAPQAAVDKPKLKAPPRVQAVVCAPSAKPQRRVYRMKYVPAIDLGKALQQVLQGETTTGKPVADKAGTVAIVAEPINNSLVISGPAKIIAQLVDLIEVLDRRPALVQVRTLIAEISTDQSEGMLDDLAAAAKLQSIEELAAAIAKRPGLRVLGCPRLTVLEDQPGRLQLGSRVPRITDAFMSPGGRTNRVSMEDVGLILSVKARTTPEGLVMMEVNLDRSRLGPEEEGTPIAVQKGEPIRTPMVETFTLQTTVSVPSGRTLLLAGVGGKSEARQTELILLVSPHIVDPQ